MVLNFLIQYWATSNQEVSWWKKTSKISRTSNWNEISHLAKFRKRNFVWTKFWVNVLFAENCTYTSWCTKFAEECKYLKCPIAPFADAKFLIFWNAMLTIGEVTDLLQRKVLTECLVPGLLLHRGAVHLLLLFSLPGEHFSIIPVQRRPS